MLVALRFTSDRLGERSHPARNPKRELPASIHVEADPGNEFVRGEKVSSFGNVFGFAGDFQERLRITLAAFVSEIEVSSMTGPGNIALTRIAGLRLANSTASTRVNVSMFPSKRSRLQTRSKVDERPSLQSIRMEPPVVCWTICKPAAWLHKNVPSEFTSHCRLRVVRSCQLEIFQDQNRRRIDQHIQPAILLVDFCHSPRGEAWVVDRTEDRHCLAILGSKFIDELKGRVAGGIRMYREAVTAICEMPRNTLANAGCTATGDPGDGGAEG